jgi:hypothetical protein
MDIWVLSFLENALHTFIGHYSLYIFLFLTFPRTVPGVYVEPYRRLSATVSRSNLDGISALAGIPFADCVIALRYFKMSVASIILQCCAPTYVNPLQFEASFSCLYALSCYLFSYFLLL